MFVSREGREGVICFELLLLSLVSRGLFLSLVSPQGLDWTRRSKQFRPLCWHVLPGASKIRPTRFYSRVFRLSQNTKISHIGYLAFDRFPYNM